MSYYATRRQLKYYSIVRQWLDDLGPLESILDIGCFDTPVATWGDFQQRYTLDRHSRPALLGVLPIVGTWPTHSHLVPRCDVVTCLQVIEHLDDPQPFVDAVFSHARRAVILSLPWMWQAGHCPSHKQDPIDMAKINAWVKRTSGRSAIVDDPSRIILSWSIHTQAD